MFWGTWLWASQDSIYKFLRRFVVVLHNVMINQGGSRINHTLSNDTYFAIADAHQFSMLSINWMIPSPFAPR